MLQDKGMTKEMYSYNDQQVKERIYMHVTWLCLYNNLELIKYESKKLQKVTKIGNLTLPFLIIVLTLAFIGKTQTTHAGIGFIALVWL